MEHETNGSNGKINRKGYILAYTGNGKGKTTASIGLAVRAAGRGMRVLMLQFIKSPQRTYGEHISLRKLGVDVRALGVGFTWTRTPEEHRDALREAWRITKEEVYSGQWDMIIMDEIHNALAIDRFPIEDVLPLQELLQLMEEKPAELHLVLTGRSAKEEVLARADLVSEIQEVKHYYQDGISAVLGLEF